MKPQLQLTGNESAVQIKNKVLKILPKSRQQSFNLFCQSVDWSHKGLAVAQILTLAKSFVVIV